MDRKQTKDMELEPRPVKNMPVLTSLRLVGLNALVFRVLAHELQEIQTLTSITLGHDVQLEFEACQHLIEAVGHHVKKLAFTGRQQLAKEHLQLAALCPLLERLDCPAGVNLGSLQKSKEARTSQLKILNTPHWGYFHIFSLAKMLSKTWPTDHRILFPALAQLRTWAPFEESQDHRSWLRHIEVCKSRDITLYVNDRPPWIHAQEEPVPCFTESEPWLYNEEMAFA